jgi:predicted N-acetyltransferase YhbS
MRDNKKSEEQFEGPRALRPEEHASALSLLNSALRVDRPAAILQEYPLVLGKENLENMRVIVRAGEVVSHAAIYFSRLRSGGLIFNVGGIGSVATHPAHQGQGLGGAVLRDCIRILRERKSHISALWTQRHGFYRNLSYEMAGSNYLFRVKADDLANVTCDCRIIPYAEEYLTAIINIHGREYLRTERTRKEYETYLGIPNTNTLLAIRDGNISAYAVMGKGEDFRHCIHEWGGNPIDLLCLSREFARLWSLSELMALAPAQQTEFARLLEKIGAKKVFEHLAMIRIIDEASLSALLCEYMIARLGGDFHIIRAGKDIIIKVGMEQTQVSTEGVLARVLFGPDPPSTLLKGFSRDTLSTLDRALPIPLFIWGLDSV